MRITRACRRGELTPDFIAGHTRLFQPERMRGIRAALNLPACK
jgi:hypothetical protein